MKYVAHLSTGETLTLELEALGKVIAEWFVDANGIAINSRHLAALVPAIDEPKPRPYAEASSFTDVDGDWWDRGEDGLYRLRTWPATAPRVDLQRSEGNPADQEGQGR